MYQMFPANPTRARLFHDESLANEDTYEPFLRWVPMQKFYNCYLVQASFFL